MINKYKINNNANLSDSAEICYLYPHIKIPHSYFRTAPSSSQYRRVATSPATPLEIYYGLEEQEDA